MLEEASVQTICPMAVAVAVADPGEGEEEGFGDAVEVGAGVPARECEVQATSVVATTNRRRRLPVALKAEGSIALSAPFRCGHHARMSGGRSSSPSASVKRQGMK